MTTLRDLALDALLRPAKERIWPGYTDFLHPDLNLTRQGQPLTKAKQSEFLAQIVKLSPDCQPEHPDTIIRVLEDLVLYAGQELDHVYNSGKDRHSPFAVNPAAQILNEKLGHLVMFAVGYWVTVWATSLKQPAFPQSTHSADLDALFDYHRRSRCYTFTGEERFLTSFGGTMTAKNLLKAALDGLVREVTQAVDQPVKQLFTTLRRYTASDIAGNYSRTLVSCVQAFHHRYNYYPFSPLLGSMLRSLRQFVGLYVCHADTTAKCDCPDQMAYACYMNNVRPRMNAACCGGLRWQPALWEQEASTASKAGFRRPTPSPYTTCEFCMLDSVTSGGYARDWGLARFNTQLKRWNPVGAYCVVRFPNFPGIAERELILMQEPFVTILKSFSLHAPHEPSALFTSEQLSDCEEEMDAYLMIEEEDDEDETDEEDTTFMQELLDIPLPFLTDLYAL